MEAEKKMNNKRKLLIKTQLSEGDPRYKLIKPATLKSNVWHKFDLIQFEGKLEEFACCRKCHDVLAYSAKTGTGSLIRHNCDNLNSRRKRQTAVSKPPPKAFNAKNTDPLKNTRINSNFEGLYVAQGFAAATHNSRKRNYDNAFDDASRINDIKTDLCTDEEDGDDEYGQYVDMDYLRANAQNEHVEETDDQHANTVLELLMRSTDGQSVLNHYHLHNRLDFKNRHLILKVLVSVFTNSECSKYINLVKRISTELVQLFPDGNFSALEIHKSVLGAQIEGNRQEDLQLHYLLSSWNSLHLYDHFRVESIGIDELKRLEKEDVDNLFKSLPLGDKIRFKYNLKAWLEQGSPLHADGALQQQRLQSGLSVTTILNDNKNVGISIRQYYEKNGNFNETYRLLLVNTILKHIEVNGLRLSLNEYQSLEQEIVELFPSEKMQFYTVAKGGSVYANIFNRRYLEHTDNNPSTSVSTGVESTCTEGYRGRANSCESTPKLY